MSINTRESYIEIGTGINADYTLQNSISLPAPTSLPFSDEFVADAKRNAEMSMMIQHKGRTQYITSIKWLKMKNTTFWRLNRFLESNGYVFYMKYLSHSDGKIKIQKFYRGNMEKANPSSHTEIFNGETVPKYYLNVSYNIIDMGQFDTVTVKTLNLN